MPYESGLSGIPGADPPKGIVLSLPAKEVKQDKGGFLDAQGKASVDVTFELDLGKAVTSQEFKDTYRGKFPEKTLALTNHFKVRVFSTAFEDGDLCSVPAADIFEVRK